MFRPTRSILIALFVLAISATTVSAQTDSVTLAWAANTEPDLAGYYLYYKIGNPSEPFDGTGVSQGDSPIKIPLAQLSDPDNPEYTLTGLDDQAVYYFVLTAYDNEDPENETPEIETPEIETSEIETPVFETGERPLHQRARVTGGRTRAPHLARTPTLFRPPSGGRPLQECLFACTSANIGWGRVTKIAAPGISGVGT